MPQADGKNRTQIFTVSVRIEDIIEVIQRV